MVREAGGRVGGECVRVKGADMPPLKTIILRGFFCTAFGTAVAYLVCLLLAVDPDYLIPLSTIGAVIGSAGGWFWTMRGRRQSRPP